MPENKLAVHYTAVGKPVSDFAIESEYQRLLIQLQRGNVNIAYSTGLMIHRLRAGIFQGDLSHEQVSFYYKGIVLVPDSDGRIDFWPPGFSDVYERVLEMLI